MVGFDGGWRRLLSQIRHQGLLAVRIRGSPASCRLVSATREKLVANEAWSHHSRTRSSCPVSSEPTSEVILADVHITSDVLVNDPPMCYRVISDSVAKRQLCVLLV